MIIYNQYINNNSEVILFFAGWGMDENPFKHIKSLRYDVIIVYNYSEIVNSNCQDKFNEINNKYDVLHIIAWSMGVSGAATIFSELNISTEKVKTCTAINGTLHHIDSNFGIPEIVYDKTIENLPQGLPKFNLRMCGSKVALENYNTAPSKRDLQEIKNELIAIKTNLKYYNRLPWNKVIIGNKDNIIPTTNQISFWSYYKETHNNELIINEIDTAHYLFHKIDNWDSIVNNNHIKEEAICIE